MMIATQATVAVPSTAPQKLPTQRDVNQAKGLFFILVMLMVVLLAAAIFLLRSRSYRASVRRATGLRDEDAPLASERRRVTVDPWVEAGRRVTVAPPAGAGGNSPDDDDTVDIDPRDLGPDDIEPNDLPPSDTGRR